MIEMITNITDHSSEIALVVDLAEDVAREREVGERDQPGRRDADRAGCGRRGRSRVRAPRRPRRHRAVSHQRGRGSMVHGNGERASTTSPWRDEQLDERALGPVVEVAGRVAEVASVGAAGHVERRATAARAGPTRAGARSPRAPSRRPCARGPARARAPRSRVATSNSPSANGRFSAFITRYSRFGAWRFAHSRLQRRVLEVDADDAAGEALRPLVGQHALAAADVEQRPRCRPRGTARRACARSRPSAA